MELTPHDAQSLTTQVADLAQAGLPLAAGLRAAADEAPNFPLASAMRLLATELEKGKSLEESLASCEGQLPAHLRGLVRAGIRSGSLGRILAELVEHQAATDDAYYRIQSALMYPLILLVVSSGLLVFSCVVLVPFYRPFLAEFYEGEFFGGPSSTLWVTNTLFWLADVGVPLLIGSGATFIVVAVIVRLAAGAARWQWLMSTVPVFGALGLDAATSELARLLGLLVEQSIPLPLALQLAAESVTDANVAEACKEAAAGVDRGEPLSQSLAATRRLPTSLIPILEWGERTNSLPSALQSADELFLGRLQLRASFVAAVLPPLILVVVVGLACFLAGAMLLPLIQAIRTLGM